MLLKYIEITLMVLFGLILMILIGAPRYSCKMRICRYMNKSFDWLNVHNEVG